MTQCQTVWITADFSLEILRPGEHRMAYYRYMKKKSVMKPNFPRSKQSTEIQDFYSSFFSVSVIKQCDQNIFVEVGVIRIKRTVSIIICDDWGRKLDIETEAEISEERFFLVRSPLVFSLLSQRNQDQEPGGWNHSQGTGLSNIFSHFQSVLLRHAHRPFSSQCFYRDSFLYMSSWQPIIAITTIMLNIGEVYSSLQKKINTPKWPWEKPKQH